jgi:hypothetical protein
MADDEAAQLHAFGERFTAFFDVNANSVISTVSDSNPDQVPATPPYPIQVVPVHTFIVEGHTKDFRLTKGFMVPSFASHWGVVVGQPGAYTLYHLVFRRGQESGNNGMTDNIRGPFREVDFHFIQWKEERSASGKKIEVGQTRYSHIELIKIGNNHASPLLDVNVV